eukprot:PhM_4_TR10019/c0_g1_i1/m.34843
MVLKTGHLQDEKSRVRSNTRSASPFKRQISSSSQPSDGRPTSFPTSTLATRISAERVTQHGDQGEIRSVAVAGDHVWCAEKERILIRRHDCSVQHIIHKTRDMGFIWVLEAVGADVWVGCSDGHIRVLNKHTYEESHDLFCHSGGVYALLLVGNRVYSGGADFQLLQWNAKTCELAHKFTGSGSAIRSLCALGHGRLASGTDDGHVRIWETATGAVQVHFQAHPSSVRAIVFVSKTGRFWTAGEDSRIKVWQTDGSNVQTLTGHSGTITTMTSFSGSVWSGGVDGTVIVWDAISGTLVEERRYHNGYVTALARVMHTDAGTMWSIGSDRLLNVWNYHCVLGPDAANEKHLDEVVRQLQESNDIKDDALQQIKLHEAEIEALRSKNDSLQRKLSNAPTAAASREVILDLELAKGRAQAEASSLRERAALVDSLNDKLMKLEQRLIDNEIDRTAHEERISKFEMEEFQVQDLKEKNASLARENAGMREDLARLERENTELRGNDSHYRSVLLQAGCSDVDGLLRRVRVLEDEVRHSKDLLHSVTVRQPPVSASPPRIRGSSSEQELISALKDKQHELEIARAEVDILRSGTEGNMKHIADLCAKIDALEDAHSKLRNELYVKDTEIAEQAKIIRSMSDRNNAHSQPQLAVETRPAETEAAAFDCDEQCSTVLNTLAAVHENVQRRHEKTRDVQDAILTKELEHVALLIKRLQASLPMANDTKQASLQQQKLESNHPKSATGTKNVTSKFGYRSTTPPRPKGFVAHTLTSQLRAQRGEQIAQTSSRRGFSPVSTSKGTPRGTNPGRSSSPVLTARSTYRPTK